MTASLPADQFNPDLRGQRIGLSGAVPDPDEWGGRALDWEILNAVTTLADTVFRGGAHLVHGSHPSFTPRILAQAEPYARERGEPVVTFVLSGLFADGMLARQLQDPRHAGVLRLILVDPVYPPGHEGQGAEDSAVRNASLAAMRDRLVNEMDSLVIIGGKRWAGTGNKPGTLEELELARARGIPYFAMGGFGGMAADLAAELEHQGQVSTRGLDGPSLTKAGRLAVDRPNAARRFDDTFIRTSNDYDRAIGRIAERLAATGP
ncbi:MAG TPA: hypothetical protein VES73_03065 [Lamprocystis sp. (in: g-proteobacteria)]|nr:hypothetical protein [Lamprocystis sp. (in: g-proteobacteria)]